jgi:sulfate transport system ATP-binding protein
VDDGSYVDVELPRADYLALRESLRLQNGVTVHLRPRRVTTFTSEGQLLDPAAAI